MKSILNRTSLCVLFLVAAGIASQLHAEVRLPGFFGDHMVLQRDAKVRIWGWADAGESVQVSLRDQTALTHADAEGRWKVELLAMAANADPQVLRVKGNNVIEIKDVLIGEVWLCSGQSNMEWTVRSSTNAKEEIANATLPLIRHLKIAHRPSNVPLDDVTATWQICSPKVAGNFTAAGYFMAKHLHQELQVPIGLINSSWGGTRVEPWTPPVGFQEVEALQGIYESVMNRTPGTDSYQAELKPFKSHQDPTMLYNGMIHPLVGYSMRGAIWYQGESNHAEGMLYFEKKKALINGWRELWNQGDFPFYYVQIAPFQYGKEDPTILARFWEAQAAVQQISNTGMVVINDIATLNNIHPPNKQDVGYRLALLALKNDYGRDDLVANSPEMESMEAKGGQLKISFRNTGGGLKTRDEKPATLFEVTGEGVDGFVAAVATIEGDTVILTSDKVAAPTAFRFAWDKIAEPNLMGGTGLPVGAFRGGE